MNNTKQTIRGWFKPETRGQFYAVATAAVALLASLGFLSTSIVPAVTAVVIAALALAYAYANSDSKKNKAVYTLTAAIGALLISLGYATDSQTEAVLAVVAPVLGISYAAAKTPEPNNLEDTVTIGAGPDPKLDGWTPTE